MSARINHAACQHPSTKVARAACRRALAKAAATIVAVATVTESPIITEWNAMKSGPLELTAAVPAVVVTRENWREYKGELVTLSVADAENALNVMITGWSENLIQYKVEGAGKLVRLPAGRIESVTA